VKETVGKTMSDWEEEEEPQALPLSVYFPGIKAVLVFNQTQCCH